MKATAARPPLCNTGANSLADVLSWDWYQGTIRGLTRSNVARMALGGPRGRWRQIPGLYGYSRGWELLDVEAGSVRVFEGSEDVHVQGTGPVAEHVASVLRDRWPEHLVSRADVAFDVVEPGAFERLYKRVHEIARDGAGRRGRKVSTSTVGDWLDGERGRTFYAGGTSSRLRVRVYEKGHEQRAKDPGCGADVNWTRAEWQLRPSSDQKAWLAAASKVEALGLTSFGAAVAEALLDEDVVSVSALLRFASQDPGYWMVRSYRRVVLELLELDPEDMRSRLVELLERAEAR